MRVLWPGIASLFLAGCAFDTAHPVSGPVEHESKKIGLGKVELVRAEITMGAGEVRLSSGTPDLLDAGFDYNVPAYKPTVRYDASGFRGRLAIDQGSNKTVAFGNIVNNWTLKLNEDVPMDLVVHLGAGKNELKVGRLSLRSLEVHMGAGELLLDMTGGEYKRNFSAEIHGGVGQATVRVPKNVGVSADVHGGIGSIQASGLDKRNGKYVNSVAETSEVRINLNINGGIGEIHLAQE